MRSDNSVLNTSLANSCLCLKCIHGFKPKAQEHEAPVNHPEIDYAHIEVLVTFLLVNFLGFLVITRDHGSFEGRHQVEILPTGLPELFKPARDLLEPRKFEILGPTFSS